MQAIETELYEDSSVKLGRKSVQDGLTDIACKGSCIGRAPCHREQAN